MTAHALQGIEDFVRSETSLVEVYHHLEDMAVQCRVEPGSAVFADSVHADVSARGSDFGLDLLAAVARGLDGLLDSRLRSPFLAASYRTS
jgi:hypothetical protein